MLFPSTELYVDVILPLPLDGCFTYSLPENLQGQCAVGKRAVVQFGNRKVYAGLVRRIHPDRPADYETKPVFAVLDDDPLVQEHQLVFWEWIADYYLCSVGEVYKAALPAGLKLESETRLFLDDQAEGLDRLGADAQLIVQVVKHQKSITIADLQKSMGQGKRMGLLKKLIDQKILCIEEHLSEGFKAKTELFVHWDADKDPHDILNALKRAPAQEKLVMAYLQLNQDLGVDIPPCQSVARKGLLAQAGDVSTSVLDALVKKGIFKIEQQTVDRLSVYSDNTQEAKPLNIHQQQALDGIKQQFSRFDAVLLHGVTASGKTEIYIHLIQEQLAQGRQVLYLLPEIALTTQIIVRLRKVFGNRVGVYHSKFSDNERVEVWNNLLGKSVDAEAYDIVLGVRSSVFLPFNNLGLILVDEEHENTYKQYDPAPRYNARDLSVVLAKLHSAKVLMGTATPAVETYFNARTGKYGLVELTKRHKEVELPEIVVVDTLLARKKYLMKSHFTKSLLNRMEDAFAAQKQVILFQNRRGFSPFVACTDCGWVPHCPNCDISLTYHKYLQRLNCHYCGHSKPLPSTCPTCGSPGLETKGFGTEKVEDEIQAMFPNIKVARMDLDTTRSRKAYEQIIGRFERGEVDVLIGTQMVTKGLDFGNVSLVGILNADNMLNFPDFRAFERSFHLMVQVSGRAGRLDGKGTVVVQTANPDHEVIMQVMHTNFLGMFEAQIAERQRFGYPPFVRLIIITLKHKQLDTLNKAASQFADSLRNTYPKNILGPEFPLVNRIQNRYLKNVMIKAPRGGGLSVIKSSIREALKVVKKEYPSLVFVVDVDPQ